MLISMDNSLPKDSYISQYHILLSEGLNRINRTISPGPELKKWVEQAGYVNVTEKVLPLPLGTWPKEMTQKEIGAWNLACLKDGLEALVMRLFTHLFKWSMNDVQDFLAMVMAELKRLKRNKVHAQYT